MNDAIIHPGHYRNQKRILEDWEIPPIEAQYKTMGTTFFYQMLQYVHGRFASDPNISLKEIINELQDQFPKKFTKSWISWPKRPVPERRASCLPHGCLVSVALWTTILSAPDSTISA